jgi:Protein of unknown function (DUF5818)
MQGIGLLDLISLARDGGSIQGGNFMSKKFWMLVAALLVSGCMAMAADSWTGTVSDSHCGAKHATASEGAEMCVAKCVKGGAKYVLVSEGKVYNLDAQDKFEDLAGKSVTVSGTMKGDSIAVDSVEAASADEDSEN